MKITIILSLCLLSQLLSAQVAPGMESNIFRLEKGYFDSHRVMIGRKIPPAEVKGDYYLESDWHKGSFTLINGRESAEYPLRYDVENALLEIQWGKLVKIAGEEQLSSFHWRDDEGSERQYINARKFDYKGTTLSGFVELLYQGDDSLLLKTDAILKEADYVPGLDMGSRHPEIIKQHTLLVVHEQKAIEIRNRKDFLAYAKEVPDKVLKRYIRREGINMKKEDDLRMLMGYYESLMNNKP